MKQWLAGMILLASWMSGCASIGEMTGLSRYWGRPEPASKQARAYAHHLAGVVYERRGELDKAKEEWQAVSSLDQTAVAPRLRLIRLHLRQGAHDEALALCKTALEHDPQRAELWIVHGELNHRAGNIEAAIAAFKKAIELRPDDPLGYGALVELQESTNDLIAAIDIYERLIEQSPESAALYYQLGVNLARIKDCRRASEVFEKVLALEPRISRARFLLALSLFELGEFERSAEEFRLYLAERPDDAAALEHRAGALARLGRLDQAQAALEQAIAQGVAEPRHYVQLAWLGMRLGSMEQAQYCALEGGAHLFADILFTLAALKNSPPGSQPANLWDDRYVLDDVETESDLLISAVLGLFGGEEAGATLLEILTTLDQRLGFSPSPTFLRARTLIFLERFAEALPVLDSLRANGIVSKHIHYYSAAALERTEDYDNAERHLHAYLEMDPDNPEALNFLGYFYAERNMKIELAEELVSRALKQDPDNPYYLDSLGWVYYRQGRAEEAASLIRRAIYGMDTDDAVLRDHLGDIYLLQGDLERALAEWRRALRLDPSQDAVREKIEAHQPDAN